ncbi:MAG: hypothetical protein AAF957_11175 [Planctomycetota bacterium]
MTRNPLVIPGTVAAALCLAAPATSQTTLYDLDAPGDGFYGSYLTPAGDVNGNGFADLAFSTPIEILAGGPFSGQFGSVEMVDGATGATIWKVENPRPRGSFGWTVGPATDVDGDGADDIIATLVDTGTGSVIVDEVTVLSGANGGIITSLAPPAGIEFGTGPLERIHDVDGDGIDELIVGAGRLVGSGSEPVLLVLSGANLRPLGELSGPPTSTSFGGSVASMPDLDGDGQQEILVGSPLDDAGGTFAGSVYFFSGLAPSPWRSILGTAGERLGRSLAPLPDVDGDGVADLAVSAVNFTTPGSVRIVSGATAQTITTHLGSNDTGGFGVSLEVLGDVDGDGRVDLAIGEPLGPAAFPEGGSVRVATAATGATIELFEGDAEDQALGWFLAPLDDFNGDGYPGLAMSGTGLTFSGTGEGRILGIDGPLGPDCTAPVIGCAQPTVNSVGGTGTAFALGSASLSGQPLRIVARDLPPGAPVLLLASPIPGSVFTPPGSQGNFCLGGPIGRSPNLGTASSSGNVLFFVDLDAIPTPLGPVAATPSDVWNFQMWYRDGGPMPTSRWTEMVTIDVCP